MTEAAPTRVRQLTLHGHQVSWREAGPADAEEVVLLLHGIAGSSETWEQVLPGLAGRGLRVIAPDLLGHGESAKPRGDYSLGAYASALRDLLRVLGHDRVTVVGHSLGGGIAMQFVYQFPELVSRLVLVGSGGLGREVSPFLRAVALPGAEWVLPLLAHRRIVSTLGRVGRALSFLPVLGRPDVTEAARGFASLAHSDARTAFVHTARSVIDLGGQRVDARDRLYLAEAVPLLLMWGGRDPIIPVGHGVEAHDLVPGSRLEVFARAGHFPHRDEPARFVEVLADFIASRPPAEVDQLEARRRLLRGGPRLAVADQPVGGPSSSAGTTRKGNGAASSSGSSPTTEATST